MAHRYMAQVAQTDWDFLRGRANEIGFDVGVTDGEFYFRPAPGMSAGGGGLAGAASAAGSMVGLGENILEFGQNLRWFRPRVTSAGMVGESEVRVWDPEAAEVVSSTSPLASATADLDDDPVALAAAHGGALSLPSIPSIPFLPSFLGASNDAHAIVDRPLGWGSVTQGAADAVAKGFAEHVGSSFAEAEGSAMNASGVTAGAKVTLKNVPSRFEGDWYVTSAQHVFDDSEGYRVRFEVSGRHDRSLGGLVAGGSTNRRQRGLVDGLVPGIVTNNIDEDGLYRVKVALPWLSPDFETDWARVVMPGLGAAYGIDRHPGDRRRGARRVRVRRRPQGVRARWAGERQHRTRSRRRRGQAGHPRRPGRQAGDRQPARQQSPDRRRRRRHVAPAARRASPSAPATTRSPSRSTT